VLDPPSNASPEWKPPRLFSKDDHRLLGLIDCRRDLDEARSAIEEFQSLWFVQDPPDKEGAREAAAHLRDTAQRLRNSALNLLYLTRAGPEDP
jgi:DNA-binding transcriptional MerR regulator